MTPEFTRQISLRLPEELLTRIEALRGREQKRAGHRARVDRSVLIRDLLTWAVAKAEKRETKRVR